MTYIILYNNHALPRMQIFPAATLQGGSMRSDHDQNFSIAPILTGYEQNHTRNRCCFLNHLRVPQPQYPFF